ncbi:hypothetical protein CDAR_622421 [Caerostris darwini]|uniref:Uncharacterized protein n=1 Tax=Caerostris darwini TaxID=1538125 RepID=A0AAV4W1I1_9ARAC|nr:hypothetical protein CDAR_622421 [Caerostris darwini]
MGLECQRGRVLKTLPKDFWRSHSEPRSRGKRKNQSNFSKQERRRRGEERSQKEERKKMEGGGKFFEDVCHFPPRRFSSLVKNFYSYYRNNSRTSNMIWCSGGYWCGKG